MQKFKFSGTPVQTCHTGMVSCLSFSPDGKLLASCGEHDRTVRMWDASTGELIHVWGCEAPITSWFSLDACAFSPNGKVLYTSGLGVALCAWDVVTGKLIWSRKGGCSCLSPDGRWAIVDRDGPRILALRSRQLLPSAHLPEDHCYAFSPNGNYVRSLNGVLVCNVKTGEVVLDEEDHTNPYFIQLREQTALVVPNENRLPSSSRVIKIPSSEPLELSGKFPFGTFFGNSESTAVVVPGTDWVVDHAEAKNLRDGSIVKLHGDPWVGAVAADASGTRVAVGFHIGDIRVYSVADWTMQWGKAGHVSATRLAVTSDSAFLAVKVRRWQDEPETTLLWDLGSLSPIGEMKDVGSQVELNLSDGRQLIYDPEFEWLCVAGSREHNTLEKAIELRQAFVAEENLFDGRERMVYDFSRTDWQTAPLTKNGRWMALFDAIEVVVFDLESGEIARRKRHSKEERWAVACALTEDGQKAAIGFVDERAQVAVLNMVSGRLRCLGHCFESVGSLAFSPDGRFVAYADVYMETIWQAGVDSRRGQKAVCLHDASLRGLVFSPDGRHLISAAADGKVVLWDAETHELKVTLTLLASDVKGPFDKWIAYTPDGLFNGSPGVEGLMTTLSGVIQQV